jgi:hypothetical protein
MVVSNSIAASLLLKAAILERVLRLKKDILYDLATAWEGTVDLDQGKGAALFLSRVDEMLSGLFDCRALLDALLTEDDTAWLSQVPTFPRPSLDVVRALFGLDTPEMDAKIGEPRLDPGMIYELFIAKDRVKKGIIYTPLPVISFIVDQVVKPETRNPARIPVLLDPSCGCGRFLTETLRCLWNAFTDATAGSETAPLLVHILRDHVLGIDEDPIATNIARINLVLEAMELGGIEDETTILVLAAAAGIGIVHGNALIGMPIPETVNILESEGSEDLKSLQESRSGIDIRPDARDEVGNFRSIHDRLQRVLDARLATHLARWESGIDLRNIHAVHYPLAFPHVFFDGEGLPLEINERGFDIVLGNPPYVNYKKYIPRLDRHYLAARFAVFDGQADLSYYFFELHDELLRPRGTSAQVSSRYFMEATHAATLRGFLARHEIDRIADLNDSNVFAGIGVHALLFFFRKQAPPLGHQIKVQYSLENETSVKLVDQDRLGTGPWELLDAAEVQMKSTFENHPKLSDLGTVISGSETGLDEAFVDHIIIEGGEFFGEFGGDKIPLEPGLIHPWLKNGDISKYRERSIRWCIYVPPGITEQILQQDYPGVHEFLSCFKGALQDRDNGTISVPWYIWRRPRNAKNLGMPAKIVLPYKAPELRAAIDLGGAYCSYDVTIFVPRDETVDLLYIAGILNSAAAAWYFSTYGKRMGQIFEYYPGPVGEIRIPVAPSERRERIVEIVAELQDLQDQIQSGGENKDPSCQLTAELDEIVWKLYGFA